MSKFPSWCLPCQGYFWTGLNCPAPWTSAFSLLNENCSASRFLPALMFWEESTFPLALAPLLPLLWFFHIRISPILFINLFFFSVHLRSSAFWGVKFIQDVPLCPCYWRERSRKPAAQTEDINRGVTGPQIILEVMRLGEITKKITKK